MRTPLSSLRQWYRDHTISIAITGMIFLLVVLFLIPAIVVTVPAGYGAVLWRRFNYFGLVEDGTVINRSFPEGTHWKLPWDEAYLYDLRIRDLTVDFPVLMNDGLRIEAEVTVRFRPIQRELGNLHKFVGLDYVKRLIEPELLADARTQIAKLTPFELYSSKRAEIEEAIYRMLIDEFEIRFSPDQAVFGANGRIRRNLVTLLADSQMPLSAADLAQLAGVDNANLVAGDLAALVADGLIVQAIVNGQTMYRINSIRLAGGKSVNDLLGTGSPLIFVEDVLVRNIELPPEITAAIQRKLSVQQEMEEYDYRVQREVKESERKRIEAQGIRQFQDIVTGGISDRYLKWKGIDATLGLAQSPNSKIVVIGAGKDGLPLILGGFEAAPGGNVGNGTASSPLAAVPLPAPPAALTNPSSLGSGATSPAPAPSTTPTSATTGSAAARPTPPPSPRPAQARQ